jgi:hypothetical protein
MKKNWAVEGHPTCILQLGNSFIWARCQLSSPEKLIQGKEFEHCLINNCGK